MWKKDVHNGRVRHLIYTFVSHASWRFEKDKIFLYIRAKIEFEEAKIHFTYSSWRLKYINV